MINSNPLEQDPDPVSEVLFKQQLRDDLKLRRKKITEQAREQASGQACINAIQWLAQLRREAGRPLRVLGYMPFGKELNIVPLLMDLVHNGNDVYVPLTDPANVEMSWHAWHPNMEMKIGSFGIQEPLPNTPQLTSKQLNEVDVVFVPGLGFDRHGGRLGMGAGYYDRFIMKQYEDTSMLPILVSIIYEWQQVAHVPMEPHDIHVHLLIRPDGVQWTYAADLSGRKGE